MSFAIYGLLSGNGPAGSDDADAITRALADNLEPYDAEFDGELKDVARDIEAVIQEHRDIIDWRENLDVLREMRRDIKRHLRDADDYTEDDLDELVRRVVEVARSRRT